MTDHEGLPVAGYMPQSDEKVQAVNRLKEQEERVLRLLDDINHAARLGADGRWLAIARTHVQQGFMAAARAVFQPSRIALPEDKD